MPALSATLTRTGPVLPSRPYISMTRQRIGFLAPAPLTNGYTAAVRFAAHLTGEPPGISTRMELRPLKTHADIVQAAAAGEIDYGVIAVENTLDGIIIESIRELERLFESERERRPYICWEELLPIRHLLINRSGDLRGRAPHRQPRQCAAAMFAISGRGAESPAGRSNSPRRSAPVRA